jgi:hypothetical protein
MTGLDYNYIAQKKRMLGFWSTAHVNLNAWTPLRLASGYGRVGAAWILVESEVDADAPGLGPWDGTVRKSRVSGKAVNRHASGRGGESYTCK